MMKNDYGEQTYLNQGASQVDTEVHTCYFTPLSTNLGGPKIIDDFVA